MSQAELLWRETGSLGFLCDRVLPDGHFRFQGGSPRDPHQYLSSERLSDPAPATIGYASR